MNRSRCARTHRKPTQSGCSGEKQRRAKTFWGRCYDHNFRRFLTILGEKIAVFLKNQCYDHNFAKLRFVLGQKRQFFAFFQRKYVFLKS
jgi:hypothetical protein